MVEGKCEVAYKGWEININTRKGQKKLSINWMGQIYIPCFHDKSIECIWPIAFFSVQRQRQMCNFSYTEYG